MREFSDDEIFGKVAPQKELTDADVFGAPKELSDADVFGAPIKVAAPAVQAEKAAAPRGVLGAFADTMGRIGDVITGRAAKRDRLEASAGVGGSVITPEYSDWELQQKADELKLRPPAPPSMTAGPANPTTYVPGSASALDVAKAIPKMAMNSLGSGLASGRRVLAAIDDQTVDEQEAKRQLKNMNFSNELATAPMTDTQKTVATAVSEGAAQAAMAAPAAMLGLPLVPTLAATMAAPAAAKSSSHYLDAGLKLPSALTFGAAQGIVEGGTEAIPMAWMMGNAKKVLPSLIEVAKTGNVRAAGEIFSTYMKGMGLEVGQEIPATIGNWAVDKLAADPTATPERLGSDMLEMLKQLPLQSVTQQALLRGGARAGRALGIADNNQDTIANALNDMVENTDLYRAGARELTDRYRAAQIDAMNASQGAEAPPPVLPPSPRYDRSSPAQGAPMAPISAQVSQPLAQEAADEAVANPPPGSERMPGGMPMAALQQGGMPTSAMPVADGIDAGVWAARGEAADDRSYDLGLAKGERQKAKRAVTSPEEDASLSSSAAQWGVDPADAIAEARKIKLNYPAKAGWAQPVALRVAEKGSTLNDRIEFAKIPYTFQNPPGMARAPRDNSAWENEVAKRMTSEMVQLTERAKSDPVARTIIDHMTWYREMARRLRQEFGGFGDVFADLLGATSPNTPVRTNWNFSVDILRRFVRGEFDSQLAALEQHLAAGGSSEEFRKAGDLITQITGKKYGMNSDKAMKALLGLWRSVKAGDAPKARNFALNLIGQSDKATIDVWAARMLQRIAGYPRIPPKAEGAVAGNHLVDPSQVGGQFGFGQAVFEKVAAALRAQGVDVTAPDLQAVAWFMEKEIWTKNGWTRGLGSEGSFENEADKMPVDRYQVGATVAQYEHEPTNPEMRQASNDFTRSLEQDPDVIAYRSIPTIGMYAGSGERSFDTEVVANAGWNPSRLIADVVSAAKDADQYDAFVSRVLAPNEPSANWRPGIELYFKTERDAAFAESVINQITKSGIDGFTLIKDPRAARGMTGEDAGGYIGLRLQYVPEIFMRWADESDAAQKAELDILRSGDQNAITGLMHSKQALMDDAIRSISAVTDIAHVAIAHYDTLVIGKENYDDYTGKPAAVDRSSRAAGGITGQSAAEVLQAAAVRLGVESKGRNGEGAVSGRSSGLPLQEVNQGGAPLRSLSVRGKSYDLDAENFGFPADPKTLEDDHPLLRPTMSESGQSIYAPDHIRGNTDLGPGMTTSALHVAIVNSHFDGKEPPKGRKPKLILMAGGGGAGKGHVKSLLEGDGLIPHGAIDLDPDEIKTKMIPEFGQLAALGDSRGAATTHEESSILAKAVFSRAMKGGYDIVFDRTMAEFEKGMKLMQDAVSAGYDVEMHAVMIDARMAAVQAMGRAQHTFRYVPPSAFLKAHKGIAAYLDAYMESGLISSATVWDNRGVTIPIAELSASEYNILDEEAYRDMVDRGAYIDVNATTLGGIYGNADEESATSRRAWAETEGAMDSGASGSGAREGGAPGELGRESGRSTGAEGQQEAGLPVTDLQQAGAGFAYAGMPVTGESAGLTQQYSPKLSEQAMDRRQLQPLEPEQRKVMDGAIADVVGTGRVPMHWAKGVTYYGIKPMGSGFANYNPADSSVGVKFGFLDEAARGNEEVARNIRGWVAHELHHFVDNYRNSSDRMFYLSAESPRMAMYLNASKQFDGVGDLANEAMKAWYGTDAPIELQQFLSYPMIQAEAMATAGYAEDAMAFAKVELFAQLGAMYAANPEAMRQHLPQWFAFFEEWNHARGDGSVERSRVTLRNLFQKSVPDVGNARGERGNGIAAGSLATGGASSDVRARGPGVGTNGPTGRDGGASPVLRSSTQAVAGQGALKAAYGYTPGTRSAAPGNNHIPTHVNYSTFSDERGLHSIYAQMSKDFERRIQEQRRGTVAISQSYQEAKDLISDESGISREQIDKMLGRKAGTAAGAAEILARMAILESAASEVDAMAKKIAGKGAIELSEKDALDFAAALDRAAMAHSTFLGARAEIGRAMNAIRHFQGMPYDIDEVSRVLKTYSGKDGLSKVAEAIATTGAGGGGGNRRTGVGALLGGSGTGGRAAAIGRISQAASKPDLLDAAIEAWKAGLLSGVPTHIANIIGNTVFTAMRVPTQAIAGMVGTFARGDERARNGELLALTAGGIVGAAQGIRAALSIAMNEDATFGPTPTEERQHAIAGQTFGASGKLGAAIDYIGKGVRMPFRALSAADGFFKMVNMYMTLYSSALRMALREGGKYWQSGFAQRVGELITEGERYMLDPGRNMGPYPISLKGRAIADEAIRDGLKYTFQEKLGNWGGAIENLRSNIRPLHFIMPFVRTPTNIFRVTLEHTPFAPMSKQFREEIKAGGHRRDVAMSQVVIGTSLGALAFAMASAGLLTGGGDPEKEARRRRRELGIPDYGVKIGDKWYEYRRGEPLGTLLGAAADMAEVSRYMTDEENEHAAMMVSYAFGNAVINKTYMSGLNDFLNVITDPERYASSWEQRMAGSVVPTGVAQIAQSQDEFIRDTRVRGDMGGMTKFMETVTNGVKARLPKTDMNPEFNRQSLPIAYDSWGQPRKQEERLFPGAPIRVGTETDDRVRQEAFRLRIKGVEPAGKVQGVKLNNDQYAEVSKEGGQLAHSILSGLMKNDFYNSLNDAQRRAVFDKVLGESRRYARGIITPTIIDQIIDRKLKQGGIDAE